MYHRPLDRQRSLGFSLIELAVVLFIVSLITAWAIPLITASTLNTRITTTKAKQELIKSALVGFLTRTNRLPCPAIAVLAPTDPAYGQEAPTPGTCSGTIPAATAVKGIVPWIALGLSDDATLDGYQQRFTYQVATAATNLNGGNVWTLRGAMTLHTDAPPSLGLAPTGNQLNSCAKTGVGDDANACNLRAAVVVLSHGSNGFGAALPSGAIKPLSAGSKELANADANTAFVRADYSENATDPFDDVVMALTPDELLGPGIQQGALKSAKAVTQEKMKSFAEDMVARIIDAGGIVPGGAGLAPPPPVDGWGNGMAYGAATTNVCPVNTGDAFTLSSNGVDEIAAVNPTTGTNDDLAFHQGATGIRNILMGRGMCP